MLFTIRSRGLATAVACFAFAAVTNDALAQSAGLFGASGATTGSNGMGTASTGATMQSSAFPVAAFPAAGAAPGAAGGLGAQAGMGGANGQQPALLGLSTGQNLIGTGAAPGQTPTGQPGQMNRQGQAGQNRNAAAGGRRAGQTRNQTNQPGGAAAGNQQKSSVRPQMVVAFDYPHHDAESTQAILTTRFGRVAKEKGRFAGIEVVADGNMVILRGEVDSAQTVRLATILARMEPGVKNVKNELTVKDSSPPSSAEPSSAEPSTNN